MLSKEKGKGLNVNYSDLTKDSFSLTDSTVIEHWNDAGIEELRGERQGIQHELPHVVQLPLLVVHLLLKDHTHFHCEWARVVWHKIHKLKNSKTVSFTLKVRKRTDSEKISNIPSPIFNNFCLGQMGWKIVCRQNQIDVRNIWNNFLPFYPADCCPATLVFICMHNS